jgi:hypothetical protein
VTAYVVLAATALKGEDVDRARAAYISMEMIGWLAILPLCLISLFTGLIQAHVTAWGLWRHYWVLAKFTLTVPASGGTARPPARGVANGGSCFASDISNERPRFSANSACGSRGGRFARVGGGDDVIHLQAQGCDAVWPRSRALLMGRVGITCLRL